VRSIFHCAIFSLLLRALPLHSLHFLRVS
jgi:hypothetical protein